MSKNFALIGAAGYVAPRHMQAIKETGNRLICAMDKSDSVGILDRYFSNVEFFTEFESFDRHIDLLKSKGKGNQLDFISICTPTFLHDSHVRFALRSGAHAICERPLVTDPSGLDILENLDKKSSFNIYNVMSFRFHPAIIKIKKAFEESKKTSGYKKHDIDISFITSRGKWYDYSWKGQLEKSGGIITNMGLPFFDVILWIFGKVQESRIYLNEARRSSGYIELENARIRWFLSLERSDLPEKTVKERKTSYRAFNVNGREIEFPGGFTDLHTHVYMDILNGGGCRPADTRPAIELVHQIRNAEVQKPGSLDAHPLA